MNIWLITVGEPIPTDPGGSRLLRTGLLAGYLSARGHQVLWWNSTFDHVRKQHRAPGDADLVLDSGARVRLLHGCGYRRNVSPRRILDHALVARRFTHQAPGLPQPDVMLCSLPTLELAVAATRHGRSHGVPVALDIRDLWPDYLAELVPPWARPLAEPLLAPMARQADAACRDADALTGNAQAFVDWGLRRAGRGADELDRPFPHAYPVRPLASDRLWQADGFWRTRGVQDDGVFTVCFFGVLSRKCDLAGVIDAAASLERAGIPMRFVLCGSGEEEATLRCRAAGLRSVMFPGWVGEAEIRVLMDLSHAGLAPYRNRAGFIGNLPNKPIEYLAGGLPVVTCLAGGEADFLRRQGCVAHYPEGDAEALAAVLGELARQPGERARMADAARRVFGANYSADVVYEAMADWLEAVAKRGKGARA
jgi:glycosyltransferase involved in cell wall biosynthesis